MQGGGEGQRQWPRDPSIGEKENKKDKKEEKPRETEGIRIRRGERKGEEEREDTTESKKPKAKENELYREIKN